MSRILTAAEGFVDRIKINKIAREVRDGKALWIKRRRRSAVPILICANVFFRLAGNPVQGIWKLAAWQRWEAECFNRLHADRFRAFVDRPRGVAADELPGTNLTLHLDGGTLTTPMLAAAARELRRAHSTQCAEFNGPWSHGDSHAGNFLYDERTDRARLIDFDVMHDARLSAEERHADDLLVFLQDMAGRISREKWLPCSLAFLDAYESREIAARVREKLVIPSGVARVWWTIRTTYLAPAELARRIADLRARI